MKITTQLITPEMAKEYLKHNAGNRPLRVSHVKWLADQMASGGWMITHQGIAFDAAGKLLDGQHRLNAVILYGNSVMMTVAAGVSKDVFQVMDSGIGRTLSDRSGLSKTCVEVLTVLGCLGEYSYLKGKLTAPQLFKYRDVFGVELEMLLMRYPSARKALTQAPIRAAAVLLMAEEMEGALDSYGRIATADLDGMTSVERGFVRQLWERRSMGRAADRVDVFIRAMKAMHFENASLTKIQLCNIDVQIKAMAARVREVCRRKGC